MGTNVVGYVVSNNGFYTDILSWTAPTRIIRTWFLFYGPKF